MSEEGMPPRAAYQLIHEELNLDGNPARNLASFVTTWMEPEADKLIMESMVKTSLIMMNILRLLKFKIGWLICWPVYLMCLINVNQLVPVP